MPLPDFHLHLDVLSLIAVLAIGWWWAERRLRPLVAPEAAPATRVQWRAWYSGVGVMLIASGWPIHDLAEQTLFSFHMLEHMLIGYVVPPLLMVGTPRWMADRTLGHPKVAPILRKVATPVVGLITFNAAIVAIHWPTAVAWQNQNEWAHFLVHLGFFTTAVLLWLPGFSPTPEIPRLSAPSRIGYIFLNTIVPIVPASLLTFSDYQLYPVYGDAPLTWGITPVEDQTIAGVIMKIGGAFYLLGLIARIWFKWIAEERNLDVLERELAN
jgi:putative membrane protein